MNRLETKLTAQQAKRLAAIKRGSGNRVPVKRGAFSAFDQRLLMRKLIWYTLQRYTSQRLFGGDGKTYTDRVLRLTAKGRKALQQYHEARIIL